MISSLLLIGLIQLGDAVLDLSYDAVSRWSRFVMRFGILETSLVMIILLGAATLLDWKKVIAGVGTASVLWWGEGRKN